MVLDCRKLRGRRGESASKILAREDHALDEMMKVLDLSGRGGYTRWATAAAGIPTASDPEKNDDTAASTRYATGTCRRIKLRRTIPASRR